MINNVRKSLMDLISTRQVGKDVQVFPEKSFLNDLKATVSALNPNKTGSNYYKPSSMNCPRQMFFTRLKYPIDNTLSEYSGVRIGETGTCSHERIQYYVSMMKNYDIDCEYIDVETYVKENSIGYLNIVEKHGYETKLFDTRYFISFLCDGIIKYNGIYYILEIKTETDIKGATRTDCDIKHRKQVTSYSLSLRIRDIMWIYEERNYCIPKTFVTHVEEEDINKLKDYLLRVESMVKENKIPDKVSEIRYCTYCNYKGECKKHQ